LTLRIIFRTGRSDTSTGHRVHAARAMRAAHVANARKLPD
jgi:hypothetical protein